MPMWSMHLLAKVRWSVSDEICTVRMEKAWLQVKCPELRINERWVETDEKMWQKGHCGIACRSISKTTVFLSCGTCARTFAWPLQIRSTAFRPLRSPIHSLFFRFGLQCFGLFQRSPKVILVLFASARVSSWPKLNIPLVASRRRYLVFAGPTFSQELCLV